MMSPRTNTDCYQPNFVTPWSSPADSGRMMHDMNSVATRRNSMQHVPFMDFSFFPVREEATSAVNSNNDIMTPNPIPPRSCDAIPLPFSQQGRHPGVIQPMPFRRPSNFFGFCGRNDRSSPAVSDPASEPSLAATSMDSSEHSVSSKSLVPSSEPSSDNANADGQRFKPFHEEKWSLRYKELLEFHKANGHSAVPHTYPKNPQLARWVKRQRRQFKLRKEGKPSTMTTERLELLDSVDFIWDSHELNWMDKLEALKAFRNEKGHCNVPSNFRDKKLATWVKCQRRQYKLYWDGKPSAMSLKRIAALERVGFEWEIRATSSAKTAAVPTPLDCSTSEEEPLPVFVNSAFMGTGEQMFLANAIADL